MGEFAAFPSIVIPSLLGMSGDLNPDETVQITAAQTSWLGEFSMTTFRRKKNDQIKIEKLVEIIEATCAYITQPIGAVFSGPVCDKFGRRKMILVASIPLTFAWIMLGFAQSFPLICIGFAVIGFCMGLKESPALTYVFLGKYLRSESEFY